MAKKKAPKTGKGETRPRGPRSQNLPEMEEVRDNVLDQLFESIGESLDAINNEKANVESNRQAAIKRMQVRNIPAYKHAGVEGVLNTSAVALRLKRSTKGGEEGLEA